MDATSWATFWAVAGLIIFLGILVYMKVPSMMANSLDKRANDIAAELEQAKKLREEAQQLLAEYQRKRNEAELQHRAFHDPLTGLANRALLSDRLDLALANAERSNGQLALMYVDLDRFKTINDRFGHAAGDRLLVEIGRRIGSWGSHCRCAKLPGRAARAHSGACSRNTY